MPHRHYTRARHGRTKLTRLPTFPTRNTPALNDDDLAPRRNAFRIMTPLTTQRTAFQENSRANPRSVVEGILLNVEYETGFQV